MGPPHRPLHHFPGRAPRKKWLGWLGKSMGKLLLPLLFKMEVSGLENIPQDRGVVIAAKHQRWEDIPLLAAALPIDTYYVAKAELFINPALRWLMNALGGVSLNRKRPIESRDSLRLIGRILCERVGLVVFPEGTYFRGRMGQGREGVLRFLSSRCDVPFLPVGIEYGGEILRTSVSIRIGRAIEDVRQLATNILLERIMIDIARLSGL